MEKRTTRTDFPSSLFPFPFLAAAIILALPVVAAAQEGKLAATLRARADAPHSTSRVIITTTSGGPADEAIRAAGGRPGRFLRAIGGQVALVPDYALRRLAARPEVLRIALDREVSGTMQRTAATVGASWVTDQLGYDGTGIGIAIIDSGVASWHDDLGPDRVAHFVDFVSDLPLAHDGYGHGTHVAGIIAGNGYDSDGARRGIAPGASLVVLRVLDEAGEGHISDVIASIDYAIEHRAEFNIRVINLSVASGVYESYTTDPLTVAAKRAVDAGIVVVTAAGNHGETVRGAVQQGGITSPGNAPWVLTVGATDHRMTPGRGDDTVAGFSSRGPTLFDGAIKPDIVAPGVAIESLADSASTIFALNADARIWGTVDTASAPYVSLTGTSMAAPVVTGTVALMLEANSALTPNLIKALLHYTAETKARAPLTAQGAGMLNARGAVQLAVALRGDAASISDPTRWSRHIVWGNQRIRVGQITASANAWRADVTWGANKTDNGETVVLGTTAEATAPWVAREGGGELSSEKELEEELTLRAWPEELRDYAWAAGQPETSPLTVRPALVMVPDDRWLWRLRAAWKQP
ncbi:MAG: S8 family peptidase [Acidobacteriota bacterium]|nr:S8 family peptidase [Acidobacteriota bacterium]